LLGSKQISERFAHKTETDEFWKQIPRVEITTASSVPIRPWICEFFAMVAERIIKTCKKANQYDYFERKIRNGN